MICSDIRKKLDGTYDDILNPKEQRQIESLPTPNLFKLEDGKHDPKVRQVTIDGLRFISVLPEGAAYASKTIKGLDEVFVACHVMFLSLHCTEPHLSTSNPHLFVHPARRC